MRAADVFGEVAGMVDVHHQSQEQLIHQRRAEIVSLRSKLKAACADNKKLQLMLQSQGREQFMELERREKALQEREDALKANIRRGDDELRIKWEMLFAAQQRLGEQESAFGAERDRFAEFKRKWRDEQTPSSTPRKGRRTISSPLGKGSDADPSQGYLQALSPMSQ